MTTPAIPPAPTAPGAAAGPTQLIAPGGAPAATPPNFQTPDFLNGAPPAPPVPGSAEDPLAALRDIHLPPDVPLFPLAPGWYVLAGLVVLVLIVLAVREWRWRQTLAYKALKMFDAEVGRAEPDDTHAVAVAASDVLRRLVRAESGEAKATLTGEAWARLLVTGRAPFAPREAAFLARAPYMPAQTAEQVAAGSITPDTLADAVRRHIRARR
ncbi:DUF4381 domain-containing protein [Xanthobacter sp. 126]|uniref:DUF4381 domain-containing protein n=1 Tax=Xanthobacter sp. 126 TaxID=1131814 RepID=UPI00045E99C3|nr:DUF4381 domain-containing protein [Xanthobacter sp. 126]